MQMLPRQCDATFCRVARVPLLMDEYGGPAPWNGIGPVPIRQDNQVIERVCAAQLFVAVRVGGADHHVVILIIFVVGPQVVWADG